MDFNRNDSLVNLFQGVNKEQIIDFRGGLTRVTVESLISALKLKKKHTPCPSQEGNFHSQLLLIDTPLSDKYMGKREILF